jgi:NadR type nicotinamide-nucleotide adenylyltransferase
LSGLKRIAIIGPECTGKTELASSLAAHYHTEWVPEYARHFIDHLNTPFGEEDLLKIAKGQLADEDRLAQNAKDYLICDTNLVVIKIWSDFRYGQTDPWILESLNTRKYDYYLLADIDIPWEPDPQREHPHMRQYFFDLYQEYLVSRGLAYGLVTGLGNDRLKQAVKLIENIS